MMRLWALVLSGFLVGCASEPTVAPIPHSFDAGGIQLLDRPLRIDFGRTETSAKEAMTKLRSEPPTGELRCGLVRALLWSDDVALYFKQGAFRGWSNGASSAGLTCVSSGDREQP